MPVVAQRPTTKNKDCVLIRQSFDKFRKINSLPLVTNISMPLRRSLIYLLLLVVGSCSQQDKKQAVRSEEDILFASMADAGIDSVVINKIDTAIRNGTYPNIHSLLIVRSNKLLYENYWPGKDQRWGQDLGTRMQGKD